MRQRSRIVMIIWHITILTTHQILQIAIIHKQCQHQISITQIQIALSIHLIIIYKIFIHTKTAQRHKFQVLH